MLTRRQFMAATAALGLAPAWAAEGLLQRALPGRSLSLPALGLGTWRNFDVEPGSAGHADAGETLSAFTAAGGRVLDCSPLYGRSSRTVGELAAGLPSREALFLCSKIWARGHRDGAAQLQHELSSFGVERIDLMYVHNLSDVATQLAMLAEARDAGQVRLLGLSHYLRGVNDELERHLRSTPIDVLQTHYSILEPDAEERLLPLAEQRGVAVFANRVFAEGALFERTRGRALPEFAAEIGVGSWAQYFLKWVLGEPRIQVAVVGTARPGHIVDNLSALRGPLPDRALRKRMADHVRAL